MDSSMVSVDETEVEALVVALKQLLVSVGPYIRDAGSVEQAEDAILHMEERDENFHRYDIVKKIRFKIEAALGTKIDEEIDKHAVVPGDTMSGQETAVNTITDKILGSTEFITLTHTLKNHIASACDYLCRNLDTEFIMDGSDKSTLGRNKPRRADLFSDEDSLIDSSLKSGDVLFMNNDQFKKMAEKLEKRKPLEMRQESLQKLIQVTTMDIQNCDMWSIVRQGLQEALADSDETLWTLSLRFVAKGLSANSPSTKDLYITLVDFLSIQFQSVTKSNIPKVRTGLDCTKPEMVKLLKGFRLMNEFQQQVPQYWLRYPEKYVEDVLDATLSLLSQYTGATTSLSSELVTPQHFLALVDPRAHWYRKWMHGHYSRSPLMKLLHKHRFIVDNAVRICLEYIEAKKALGFEQVNRPESSNTDDQKRAVYSGEELDFLLFVHSVYLLGRLMAFKQGRQFFPINVRDREEPVTMTSFIVSLIQLATYPTYTPVIHRPYMDFDPCRLVVDTIRRLCSSEVKCQQCLCVDEVTNALLAPLAFWLEGSTESGVTPPSEAAMLNAADILSHIGTNSCGRRHLLYGQHGSRFSKFKSSPVHTLAQFGKKALTGTLSCDIVPKPSLAVMGNVLFVCRQLYSTTEGLHALSSYELHKALAKAWKLASQEADRSTTPTNPEEWEEAPSIANIVLWEDLLRDNLLNFSGTPKGLLHLQQTGAINECAYNMYSRYARKLPVSLCEKFGYGYMMSQMSAVSPGAVALKNTGLMSSLMHSVWDYLEVVDDLQLHIPRSWSVDIIDKSLRKSFNSLASLLSSYHAVYEMLAGVELPTKESYTFREPPTTLQGLLDRIVVVNSDSKLYSLFNYEQSHVFGLRLLSVMTSCLDTTLLLQTQYSFQQSLHENQKANTTEDSSEIIIDMLSVERNYLLVKTYLVGGPSERCLPSRTLTKKGEVYTFPLFSSYPVPKEYLPAVSGKSAAAKLHESELSKMLASSKKPDQASAWMEKCKKSFCSLLTTKPEHAKGPVLQDLLERVVQMLSGQPEEEVFPLLEYTGSDSQLKTMKLTPLQKMGVDLTIRYGTQLKLLSGGSEAKDKLVHLVKKTSQYLKQQLRTNPSGSLRCLHSGNIGYDWFLATIFLMMHGNGERAWKLVHNFSALAASAYLWAERLHCSVHLIQPLMLSGISPIYTKTCHNVELLLEIEVPHVFSAFRMSGFSPSQICQQWIRQCFWNYLDWREICHYVCTCVVLGVDYQVYMCVAILKYQQTRILQHMQDKNLIVFLKEEPIRGYHVSEHLEYMRHLESQYRKIVLADMLNITQP